MTADGQPLLTFVGAATLDALALVDRYPEADERVVASQLCYAGGGPAATAAVVAARLGHRTAFVGAVGDDDEGERIVAGLRAEGIDTSCVVVVPGAHSGASVVVVSAATSSRAISNRPLPLVDLAAQPGVAELLANSTWVHVDHIGWRPTMSVISGLAEKPQVSYDGGHQVADFNAEGISLYVPTIEALQVRYGDQPVRDLLHLAQAESNGIVVATNGSAGAVALDGDANLINVEAFQLEIVSTLGAGDVFHGALVAELAASHPLPEAILRANAIAALSCRALDGRSAIPRAAEVEAFLAAHRPKATSPETTDRGVNE